MKKIRIGVLSFAHGHINAYCAQLKNFPDAELIAVWDDNQARGREAAERFGMEFIADYKDLVARPDIDAVIITSETNRHAELAEAACAAGKHILCQKPMATTLEDCDRIIEAVEKSGVHFQMAFQMRCDPLNQQIKKWIEEGAVGRVGSLRRRHCINFLFNPTIATGPSAWHIDPVANVGMFFDDAVHAADFLYWIMGKPVSVMAEIDNILTTVAPDDTGIALYRWESGAMGVLFNSSVTLAGENTCEIYGDEGVIIQNYDDGVSVTHAPPGAVA
ncbi:Gfo/Idh/MocA family protein, partial [Armatimonas sp.]|uniref:Gfo/Idh/MocA family protein n=1 Tax=Armatimonas sp. TaxID=1872638 RepID=UPI003751C8C6